MSQINIFKIRKECEGALGSCLSSYEKSVVKKIGNRECRLFYRAPITTDYVSWKWVFGLFDIGAVSSIEQAKACVLIKKTNDCSYAISWGGAHYDIEKFADLDFGFQVATRFSLLQTKLSAVVNANSRRNRTISTYRDMNRLEVNSGESYTKLKFAAVLNDAPQGLQSLIEAGGSVKLSVDSPTLEKICEVLAFIERKLLAEPIQKIPLFTKIVDKKLLMDINAELSRTFSLDNPSLAISEFDVIGEDIVFRHADKYKVKCGKISVEISSLDTETVKKFFNDNGISSVETILETKFVPVSELGQKDTRRLIELIDYTLEDKSAVLMKGVWYQYNDDYLKYLHEGLSDIEVHCDAKYNISSREIEEFVKEKSKSLKGKVGYKGMSDANRLEQVRKQYYRERVFNCLREKDGFVLGDRVLTKVANDKIEPFDLKKDDCLFSVKIGDGSAALSYVVTQSEIVIDLIKNDNRFKSLRKEIKKVALWIVFKRKNSFSFRNGKFAWQDVNMLLLKNMINNWKTKARMAGLVPEVWINYMKK